MGIICSLLTDVEGLGFENLGAGGGVQPAAQRGKVCHLSPPRIRCYESEMTNVGIGIVSRGVAKRDIQSGIIFIKLFSNFEIKGTFPHDHSI